ncbi:hypothetical protein SteCoe_30342 [Stentor coeruleus]|uniref:Uncharacterized protein n=1 Tax=Stentor coeruleus TaxID=5963 RepID=A0A1R2B438_9CILI|nr:hypothetical protein SteCoe_30342 [Stentor coeruleus]
MYCKGSPMSTASTRLNASPLTKLKFSRKFIINLDENEVKPENPDQIEINKLQRKILRYKRRYHDKKSKAKAEYKSNINLRLDIENSEIKIQKLYTELENEYKIRENMMIENKEVDKIFDLVQEKLENQTLSLSNGDSGNKLSVNATLLEDIQEQLFVSNKKTSDMERLLSREQKKNEGLAKELRNLKLDLSSLNSK